MTNERTNHADLDEMLAQLTEERESAKAQVERIDEQIAELEKGLEGGEETETQHAAKMAPDAARRSIEGLFELRQMNERLLALHEQMAGQVQAMRSIEESQGKER